MNQSYFVLEFAHSLPGRIRRIHISRKFFASVFGILIIVFLLFAALFFSYAQMSWKASHYEKLRAQFDQLRGRYQALQRVSQHHNEQIAALEDLPTEVSVAYGINPPAFSATQPSLAPPNPP